MPSRSASSPSVASKLRRRFVGMLWIVLFVAASLGAAQAGNDVPGRARIQPLTPQNEQMGEQAGIQTGDATATPSAEFAAAPAAQAPQTPTGGTLPTTDYVLGIGDHIRLTVYGEDDLSGEYEVNSTGMMALPLIGAIKAAGTTLREFEEAVRVKLKAGYLNDPRVSVQVANYRPFFILGEVSKPGSYPYVNGMTVLNAVALAGGYTYRADDGGVTIVHATDAQKKEQRAREDDIVMPGDIVRVPERLF